MEISARNVLKGKVESVTKGQVMASIKIKVEDPTTITAVITKESADKLDIKEGDDLAAIIKSTEVIVGKE
jgi:molybdopterin-binding protein